MDMQTAAAAPSTQSFDFLNERLDAERKEVQEAKEQPQGLDNFLDDLIAGGRQEIEEKKQLKEARKLVKRTNLSGTEKNNLLSTITGLELKHDWREVADTIWIHRCTCEQCGKETPQFMGYFRRLHNRHMKVDRWIALDPNTESSLPREMKTDHTTTPMCADCIPQILMEDGWLTAEGMDTDALEDEYPEDTPQDDDSSSPPF
jgi:hypothetical protein